MFKLFDHDKDKFLNRHEFEEGIRGFINAPELTITPEQIDALWMETDLNKDEKISWAEFNYRFCGGPNPNTLLKKTEKKLSLHLQTPRKKPDPNGKNSALNDLKGVLEAIYDGPKVRYKGVDLTKTKQLNPGAFKKLLGQVLAEEKAEAKEKKRPVEEWALPLASGGIDSKVADKLFNQLDDKKTGKLDLTQFFEQLKLRPATGNMNKSNKKKKNTTKSLSGPQSYVLTTVKAEHVRDFISEQILKHFPPNVNHSVKCHPPLKHWGDDERKKKGLNTEGYKTTIFLSERTKIKAIVKLPPTDPVVSPTNGASSSSSSDVKSPTSTARKSSAASSSSSNKKPTSAPSAKPSSAKPASATSTRLTSPQPPEPVNHSDILIFAVFRTEYTSMARSEFLYHARVTMDEDENVKKVEVKEVKSWVDGEIDKHAEDSGTFEDWIAYVGIPDEFEEMSIPPIA